MAENAVGTRIWLDMEATIGPFFSLSALAASHSGSLEASADIRMAAGYTAVDAKFVQHGYFLRGATCGRVQRRSAAAGPDDTIRR